MPHEHKRNDHRNMLNINTVEKYYMVAILKNLLNFPSP